jgi:AcrR family transcriptional regulator
MVQPDAIDHEADGRERILAVAAQVLDTHGEAALRIADVAETADVALGLISYHFGGRDGLIVAAQQRRFAGLVKDDQAAFEQILDSVTTRDELVAALGAMTIALLDEARATTRMSRIAAVASAFGRDEAHMVMGAIVSQLLDGHRILIERAQVRGRIRIDLDARAMATFVQSYALGLVTFDLDPAPPTPAQMHAVIMAAVAGFLTDGT